MRANTFQAKPLAALVFETGSAAELPATGSFDRRILPKEEWVSHATNFVGGFDC
jgi:hypothetical protein